MSVCIGNLAARGPAKSWACLAGPCLRLRDTRSLTPGDDVRGQPLRAERIASHTQFGAFVAAAAPETSGPSFSVYTPMRSDLPRGKNARRDPILWQTGAERGVNGGDRWRRRITVVVARAMSEKAKGPDVEKTRRIRRRGDRRFLWLAGGALELYSYSGEERWSRLFTLGREGLATYWGQLFPRSRDQLEHKT